MSTPRNALILSTHNTGLSLIRSLGENGIPVIALYYDPLDMGYASRYVRERYRIPHPEKEESAFLMFLIRLSATAPRGILFPADDASLVALSRNHRILSDYYTVACTEWKVSERYIQKKNTYRLAEVAGIPAPQTFSPTSIEEAFDLARAIGYPCLLKPCQSHKFFERFRCKLFKAASEAQLVDGLRRAEEAGLEMMLQEYIPGDDALGVNYNSYFWGEKALVEFTAEKVRLSPMDSGVPSVVVSRDIPEVRSYGRRILSTMGFSGYSCTEFKKDPRDGLYKLMEVNGRHNRSGLLAYRCGINFAKIQYDHLAEGRIPDDGSAFTENIYWIDGIKDFWSSIHYLRKPGNTIMSFLRPYLSRKVFASMSWRDPAPFIKRLWDLLRMFVKMPRSRGETKNKVIRMQEKSL